MEGEAARGSALARDGQRHRTPGGQTECTEAVDRIHSLPHTLRRTRCTASKRGAPCTPTRKPTRLHHNTKPTLLHHDTKLTFQNTW